MCYIACKIYLHSIVARWVLPTAPTHGGMARLSSPVGWLHTAINFPHRDLNPHTVTHLSTNRARCRASSLIVTITVDLYYIQIRAQVHYISQSVNVDWIWI